MSVTGFAILHSIKRDFFFDSRKTLSKGNLYDVFNILSSFIFSGSLSSPKSTHISKNRTENILYIDISKIKSPHSAKISSLRCSKLIIPCLLLWIRKDSIRLIDFFKLIFFALVPTMSVWVVFHSFFSVCFFYLFCRGIFFDSENGIVILIHRTGLYDFLFFRKG